MSSGFAVIRLLGLQTRKLLLFRNHQPQTYTLDIASLVESRSLQRQKVFMISLYSTLSSSEEDLSQAHYGVLPTPSPELVHPCAHPFHPSHDMLMPSQSVPSWEVLPDSSGSVGSKRSYDYSSGMDAFFTDMKKRRVDPLYDSREWKCLILSPYGSLFLGMAERLNDIAYGPTGSSNTFNPRSVSLDIRTPEELAAVNEFLVTLGRDVSAPRQSLHISNSHSSLYPNYFDAANLAQLGLSDMPGLPEPNDFSDDQPYAGHQYTNGSCSSRSVPVPSSNMYTTMETSAKLNGNYNLGRSAQQYQSSYGTHHHQYSTPSMDGGSPHSTVSAPVTTTPQVPLPVSGFDFHRMRSIPHVAQLAPPEYSSKPMRPMVALRSLPSDDRPTLIEPRSSLAQSSPRNIGPPTSSDRNLVSISKPGSLYPMLTPGDKRVTLPPLSTICRSPSQPRSYYSVSHHRESTPSSAESFEPGNAILPSFSDIDSLAPRARCPQPEDQLVNDVKMMDLEKRNLALGEQRKRHAELILELLVKINSDFKSKYDLPISLPLPTVPAFSPRDVEMTAA